MNLRQKLLLLFSLTVAATVAAVTWTVLVRIRVVFEQRNQEETALFVNQFQREFQHRSADVASAVDRMAASERVRAMAFELAQSGDASTYLTEAQTLAQDAQLDFLEIVGADGNEVGVELIGHGHRAGRDRRRGVRCARRRLPCGGRRGRRAVARAGEPGRRAVERHRRLIPSPCQESAGVRIFGPRASPRRTRTRRH